MTDHDAMVANIKACWDQASDEDRAYGATWYRAAHEEARVVGRGNVAKGAAVIAALSVQKSWGTNLDLAYRAVESGIASGNTTLQNRKAQAFLDYDGEFTLKYVASVLGPYANKTKAFYRNISDPDDLAQVTIDRHAHGAALGRVTSDAERNALSSKNRRVYASFEAAYQAVALIVGESPLVVQATVWEFWRRTKAVVLDDLLESDEALQEWE